MNLDQATCLAGEKRWEIRSSNAHFRGLVAFAASGAGRIWGVGCMVQAMWVGKGELLNENSRALHGLDENGLDEYGLCLGLRWHRSL